MKNVLSKLWRMICIASYHLLMGSFYYFGVIAAVMLCVLIFAFLGALFTGIDLVIQNDALHIMGNGVQMPIFGTANTPLRLLAELMGYGIIAILVTFFPGMIGSFMLEDVRLEKLNDERNQIFREMVENHRNYTEKQVHDVFWGWSNSWFRSFRSQVRYYEHLNEMYNQEVRKLR